MRRPVPLLLALALLGVAALTGCGDDDAGEVGTGEEPVPGPSVEIALEGRTFTAEAVEGHEVVPGTAITITFRDDVVTVDAGCNGLSGTYRADGADLAVRDLVGTEMGCDPALMDQDAWISAFLAGGTTMDLVDDPDGISLTAEDGDSLVLVGVEPEEDVALSGPTWTLDTITEGGSAGSVPETVTATITFAADGTYGVAAGCNSGSGTYAEAAPGTYAIDPPALTRRRCDDAAMEVERAVVGLLDGEVAASIEDDRLTLTSPDGAGLGFTAG